MIGTPLDKMFAKVSDLNSTILCSAFREKYSSEGIFQAKLFPGVKETLKDLKNWFTLGVITSKKEEIATKLLKYLKIENYFAYILGETDQRKSKTHHKLIQYLLNKYEGYKFVIIGDHPYDKELAEMLKCPFIGVLTGNHSREDLKSKNENVKILILNNVNEINRKLINSLF